MLSHLCSHLPLPTGKDFPVRITLAAVLAMAVVVLRPISPVDTQAATGRIAVRARILSTEVQQRVIEQVHQRLARDVPERAWVIPPSSDTLGLVRIEAVDEPTSHTLTITTEWVAN